MAMRKEYRPFNVEQAKAGAPYGGLWNDFEYVIDWFGDTYVTGRVRLNSDHKWKPFGFECERFSDVVMLPLFHCQGKAVYMGDTLYDANGSAFQVELSHTQSMIEECSWEAPVVIYKTRMKGDELLALIDLEAPAESNLSIAANAAIARAIEDGDVVPKEKVKEIVEFVCRLDVADAEVAWVHVDSAYFGD